MKEPGGERSYSFSTSALDGGERSASRPGRALPPGKEPPVPIWQEGGWALETVWTENMSTVKKKIKNLLAVIMKDSLEVNAQKTKYLL
jgi:hypothetical protein